jgi:hypothetical protein
MKNTVAVIISSICAVSVLYLFTGILDGKELLGASIAAFAGPMALIANYWN